MVICKWINNKQDIRSGLMSSDAGRGLVVRCWRPRASQMQTIYSLDDQLLVSEEVLCCTKPGALALHHFRSVQANRADIARIIKPRTSEISIKATFRLDKRDVFPARH